MINPCFKRWLWFVALWFCGVLGLSLVALLIRWALNVA
ncbi:DUF2474 family protein [Photobacterium proteolyticum]|nr:DUF2474 family protein [Photobacterium proteolyticum]